VLVLFAVVLICLILGHDAEADLPAHITDGHDSVAYGVVSYLPILPSPSIETPLAPPVSLNIYLQKKQKI